MSSIITIKKSSVASKVPLVTDLDYGELALNYADGKLYFKNAANLIKSFNIGGSGSGLDADTLDGYNSSAFALLTGATFSGAISTTSSDITSGNALVSTNSIGDEGGEIRLAKAATNTTLSTSITIDIYQNKLRIFETGGTNRGYYLDLSTASAGVASNLAAGGAGGVTSVSGTGTVSGLTLTGTVTSSGSLTLGGTLSVTPSNFASQTANTVLAAPNGSAGTPTFRALVAADIPTLNQNTTGTAGGLSATLGVSSGGTGQTSFTSNYILYGSFASSASLQFDGTTMRVGSATLLGGATNPIIGMTGAANGYIQSYVYNTTNGVSSSADICAYASNSTDAHGWADMGFTSPSYADTLYTVTGPNEAYLFGSALNSTYTGNLVYATDSTGSANAHQWYVGGFAQAKSAYKMQLSASALDIKVATNVTGTLTATTFSGSGASLTNLPAATALNTANNYQVNSIGVGTAASGTAGEIRATNNITAYYSDDRLKTRLGNIENALAKVRTLNGFLYEANDTAQALGYKKVLEVGVSAQEVQRVQPEIVVPAPIDDKYLTVRYERLVPLLVEAIKELDNELQQIKRML